MEKLRSYLNSLSKCRRAQYAVACGTTENYLRKAVSAKQRLGADLCIALERESDGAVKCEDLRPDADWAYMRASHATDSEKDTEERQAHA